MITDKNGARVDDTTAVHRLAAALTLQFPGTGSGDRLGRLLVEIGALSEAIMTIEQGVPFPMANPSEVLAEALFGVIRAAGWVAPDHQLTLHPPNYRSCWHNSNPRVLLDLLTQAGGALGQTAGLASRADNQGRADTAATDVAQAVDLVISRTLALVDHYSLRHDLRSVIQRTYLMDQNEGFLR